MMAVAPHHWFVQPLLALYITFGVGYCFIPCLRQCEKPTYRIKTISSHTLFFYPLSSGNWEAYKIQVTMKNHEKAMSYESPQVQVIEVEVEKGFATSDGAETPDYDI